MFDSKKLYFEQQSLKASDVMNEPLFNSIFNTGFYWTCYLTDQLGVILFAPLEM